MSKFVNVTIADPTASILQLNSVFQHGSTLPEEGLQDIINYLLAIKAGTKAGSVALAITGTNPSVAAGGGGNSATYNLL